MSVGMIAVSDEGPRGDEVGDPGSGDDLGDIMDFLKKEATNGIIINGLLVWIDIQQRSTPTKIWQAQASYAFCDVEVEMARSALWKAAGKRVDLIGDLSGHKSPRKKEKNLGDIDRAMTKLRENDALPLLLHM